MPLNDLAALIDQTRQRDADNPALIRDPSLSKRISTPLFASRMNQINADPVNDPQDGGTRQKA